MAVDDGPMMEKRIKQRDSQIKKERDVFKNIVVQTVIDEQRKQRDFNSFINKHLNGEKGKSV